MPRARGIEAKLEEKKRTGVQPLEGKIERCAADALRAGALGVSTCFSITQTRENVLTAVYGGRGGG